MFANKNFMCYFTHTIFLFPNTPMKNTTAKVKFDGNFVDYFIRMIGIIILTVLTFGLALPYLFYFNNKYFFSRMTIVFGEETAKKKKPKSERPLFVWSKKDLEEYED